MKTTAATMVVETSSEPAIVLVVRPVPKPSAAERISALNAKMNADPARLARLAAANTRRLAGKPCL